MDVKQAFDAAAPGYDGLRRQLIPCFDDFYGAAVDALGFPAGAAPRILDLGAGTGLLAEQVLARWPRARLTLVDLSGDMLERARERFAGRGARVEIRTADYLRDPLGGPYDAVVSALSIHHLPDAGKRALFRRAFAALRPGGRFVDADNVLAPTPRLAARDRALWIARVRESGIAEAGALGRPATHPPRRAGAAPLPARPGCAAPGSPTWTAATSGSTSPCSAGDAPRSDPGSTLGGSPRRGRGRGAHGRRDPQLAHEPERVPLGPALHDLPALEPVDGDALDRAAPAHRLEPQELPLVGSGHAPVQRCRFHHPYRH